MRAGSSTTAGRITTTASRSSRTRASSWTMQRSSSTTAKCNTSTAWKSTKTRWTSTKRAGQSMKTASPSTRTASRSLRAAKKSLPRDGDSWKAASSQLNSLAKTVTDALAGTGSPYAGAPGKLLEDLGRGDSAAIAATDAALGGMRAQLDRRHRAGAGRDRQDAGTAH